MQPHKRVGDTLTKEAVIIEIKTVHHGETLEGQCDLALRQIEDRIYDAHLELERYRKITKYGIAFRCKQCKVKKAKPFSHFQ